MTISIITACYNSEKYIQSAIESVLKQDYPDIEYLIIDGGSTDDTFNIVQEYKPAFKGRLKWLSEPDNGLYDALNKGIRIANGEIIGILHADDFFTSNTALSDIAGTFRHSDCEAIYGDIHFVDPDDLKTCVRYYSSAIFKRSLMRMGFMPAHPTFYAYKQLFEQFGYYNTGYRIAADFELLLRFIYIQNIRTQYVPLDFVTMRTGGMSTESFASRKLIMQEHLRAFKENKIRTNRLVLSLRYPYKIYEIVKATMARNFYNVNSFGLSGKSLKIR